MNQISQMNILKKSYIIIFAIGVLVLIFFSSSMFFTIQPGERAIIFRPFGDGLDKEHIFLPGFHVVAPWNDLIVYDVKEQHRITSYNVCYTKLLRFCLINDRLLYFTTLG